MDNDDVDIFDLLNEVLDDKSFSHHVPYYQIYYNDTGLPVLCKHCKQNNWICAGDSGRQVFECHHPELSDEYGIPIEVLDSIPAHKVYTKDNSFDIGMEGV